MKYAIHPTNVYKFHIWREDQSYNDGRDHFVIADSEQSALEKMKVFERYMAEHCSCPIKYNLNPRLYIRDAMEVKE